MTETVSDDVEPLESAIVHLNMVVKEKDEEIASLKKQV